MTIETENPADFDIIPATDEKSRITAALKKIAAKSTGVRRLDNYYRGLHSPNFRSEKFRTYFGERLRDFRDNLCRVVVQAPADRLQITGFSNDKNSDVYKKSWEIWKRSQMPKYSRDIHRDALKVGDAFVVVWAGPDDKVQIYPQCSEDCTAFYDAETGEVAWGAKRWKGDDKRIYLTLYFPDRIEKYVSRGVQAEGNVPQTGNSFIRRQVDGEVWPVPNETGICPLFHFGREDSILTDVIPINDALNKTICDLLVASEANSMRQRYVSGLSYEVDPETGKQVIPFGENATWYVAENENSKFGQFPEVALEPIIKTMKDFREEIAAVSGIPTYYFRLETGTLPSGEALRKTETRFTSLVQDAQLDFGEPWAGVMKMALLLEGVKIDDTAAEQLETLWSPADQMSVTEQVALATSKKAVGVSTERALSELGYSDADIKSMQKENQDAAANNANAFSSVFNAGPTVK